MNPRALRTLSAMLVIVLAALISAAPATAAGTATFKVTLTDISPVTGTPTGDPDATGTAKLWLNAKTGTVCYLIKAADLDAPTAAHIHDLATGGIAVDLQASFTWRGHRYMAMGCVEADPALVQQIIADPASFYINVHNIPYPGGALAGVL